MRILSKKLGITPENLDRIVEIFLIEYKFVREQSGEKLSILDKTCKYDRPEVYLDNRVVCLVYALPLTDTTSRVIVEAASDSGEGLTQIQKLSDYILEIATEYELKITVDHQKADHLKGGRPKNEANEFAYHQVNVLGRPPAEVYPEWEKMKGESISLLVDPRDSFRKAIRKKPN
ncbi:MAG: hypothetical protein C3F13_09985 [Anaerolineales bacterium]|nr:hypothetical protein [Anaerolineae bacterium]PWB53154.1 MAG: hypothetical protein C3F13_09985 [Anaerolineales bacterium]